MCPDTTADGERRTNAGRKAFTLVELLVVTAIIAILAALLLPVLSSATRKAKDVHCQDREKELGA